MGVGVSRFKDILIMLVVLTPVAAEVYDPVESGLRKKAIGCAPCHRLNGVSRFPGIPHLAGQKRNVLLDQIRDFLKKKHPRPRSGMAFRSEGVMEHSVDGLSEKDAFDLASFFPVCRVH
jgi:cytochrome c553